MKKFKKVLMLMVAVLLILSLSGCTQADRVSSNLSQEADNFNILRKLSVINQRTDTLLFTMTGNFSIGHSNGELTITGENENGTYYKHFVYLSDEITYIVEDLGKTSVNKHKYEINFNPNIIIPFEATIID
ncbi:MAG: hypothetical protein EWM50_07795 [Gottschalkiaceae bacterium]|nr:MAG: hypothetical protein EWM50_07795 [Gottschalkiaceae bacterium]